MIENKGVRILIDPKAVLFLLGTEMDYKVEKLSAQFIFNNPNQTAACGCGESVQLEPASEASLHGQSHNHGYAIRAGRAASGLASGLRGVVGTQQPTPMEIHAADRSPLDGF